MCTARFFTACLLTPILFSTCLAQSPLTNLSPEHLDTVISSLRYIPVSEIRSVDVYVDNKGHIHLLLASSEGRDSHPELYYLRSEDGGYSWLSPVEIKTNQGSPTESKRGNDLQVAAHGEDAVAVWQITGEFPGNGVLVSAWSADKGRHWQAGTNPSDDQSPGDHGYMDLLADEQGHFHLVWFDDREETGNYNGLRYARSLDGGYRWERNLTLDDETCTCCWSRVTQSRGNVLNVLYRDADPRDMALMRSENGGNHWRRVGPVGGFQWEFIGCPRNGGGLAAVDLQGQEILHSVVWTGSEGVQGLYYLRSSDQGRTWTSLFRLGNDRAQHGDVAAEQNQVVAVWDVAGPDGSLIYMSQSLDGGQSWAEARRLSAPGASGSHPRVVATPSGFLSLWTEKMGNTPQRLAMAMLSKGERPYLTK